MTEDEFNQIPDPETEYPTTGKYQHIPMCCGTPLQNDRCRVCGSSYKEE